MKKTTLIAFIGGILVFFAGCLKPTVYPDVPEITFENLVQYDDNTADLIIGFIDGDGDIGLDQADTTGDYCADTCLYHWNLFLEYYELQNGVWEHLYIDWTENTNIPFYYRIPNVSPTGQNPALVGEIKLNMPAYFLFTEFDTARFEVKLVDRALHESNAVLTRTFIKP